MVYIWLAFEMLNFSPLTAVSAGEDAPNQSTMTSGEGPSSQSAITAGSCPTTPGAVGADTDSVITEDGEAPESGPDDVAPSVVLPGTMCCAVFMHSLSRVFFSG